MPQPASEKVLEIITHGLQTLMMACGSSGFAWDIISQLELHSVEVAGVVEDGQGGTKPEKGATATVIMKTKVTDEMCNLGRNMHGGCQAFLLDFCTSLPVMALRADGAWETSGVTANLGCNYLRAIPLDSEILLVSTVLSKGSRLATIDFRIVDEKGTLYSQGTHTKMDDTQQRRERKSKL